MINITETRLRKGIQFGLGSMGIWTPELEDIMFSEISNQALSQHDVSICTCGTEEYSENEPRVDGITYCGKCDKPY